MIILKDDDLLHVDSSTNILEHYGVKGMKWLVNTLGAVQKIYQNN